jgi:phosphoribosylformylglycinamidine synthase
VPPRVDLDAARALHELVAALVHDRLVAGAHDCSEGGLAVAVAEMAIAGSCGCSLELPEEARAVVPALSWFSESASRVVLAVADAHLGEVQSRAGAAGVPVAAIGRAGGDRLAAPDFDVALADAADAWHDAIPRALGQGS